MKIKDMIWIMIVLAMFVLAVGALMFVVIRDIRRTRKKYDGESTKGE